MITVPLSVQSTADPLSKQPIGYVEARSTRSRQTAAPDRRLSEVQECHPSGGEGNEFCRVADRVIVRVMIYDHVLGAYVCTYVHTWRAVRVCVLILVLLSSNTNTTFVNSSLGAVLQD